MLTVSLLLAAVALAAVIFLTLRVAKQQHKIEAAEGQIQSLVDNLNALCSGAVGLDQRVHGLEREGRDLASRQESIESNAHGEQPYGEAIRLVQQGADATELVEQLGLSRSEADLVVMLHGNKVEQ